MGEIHETLTRQWHMLRHIPRAPAKASTSQLQKRLAADGYPTTVRTIQRDLQELIRTGVFRLNEDRTSKPYGWSWAKEGTPFHLPSLSVSDALLLQMIQQHLLNMLPEGMVSELLPQFEAAARRLESAVGNRRHRWLRLVRVIPPTQQLKGPEVARAVRAAVYDALLEERRVDLSYKRRNAKVPSSYEVNPLGVVLRGPVAYLVGTVVGYTDPRLFAMHRIRAARVLPLPIDRPEGFDLGQYLHAGGLDFGSGKRLTVKLRFFDGAGDHLHDQLLSEDQVVSDCGGGVVEVAATVADTPQFRWWILGFGSSAEVITPTRLRRAIAMEAVRSLQRYRCDQS